LEHQSALSINLPLLRFVPCATEITVGTGMQWLAINWRQENWHLIPEW